MAGKLVGIDIGSSTIKLVEMFSDGGNFSLVTAGISPTPSGSLFSESEITQKSLASEIARLAKESKATTNLVSVALLESQVVTKVIEMPVMGDNEVASAIKWEAEQYIPWAIADVSLDWQILERPGKGEKLTSDSKMQVLLVVSPTSLVNKYVKIIKMAGMETVGVETEVLALSRAIYYSDVNAPPTMVLDIGAMNTNICIIDKGIMVFARTIATGGVALTRAVASDLNLEFAQAEEYKKTYGLESDKLSGQVYNSLKPIFDVIMNEVKRAFTFYQNLKPNNPIKRIVVSGGGGKLPGLVFYIASELADMEIQIADPWKNVRFPANLHYDPRAQASDFATAVGLSMKEL